MSFLSKLLGRRADSRAPTRALWHRIVAIAREPRWYARYGVADTVPGRFDAVVLVLALVLLRMERDEQLIPPSVHLTEMFVDDMDGQLRESGVGDLVVGKKMGKLMGVLGGRLGALREALPQGPAVLQQVLERNVTLTEGSDPANLTRATAELAEIIARLSSEDLLAARIAW